VSTFLHRVNDDPEMILEVSFEAVSLGEVEVALFSHAPRFFPGTLRVAVYRVGPVLVDTGSPYDLPLLLSWLSLSPPRVVLLTHHHEDHAGGVLGISEFFPEVKVYAPPKTLSYLKDPPPLPFYRKAIWGEAPPLSGIHPLPEEGHLEVEGRRFSILPTPGHTPWHVSFLYHGSRSYLFLGDLITRYRSPLEWYECSIPAKIRSLNWILETVTDPFLLPSHLPPEEGGREKLEGERRWLEGEREQVLRKAEELGTRDPAVISQALYGREPALFSLSQGEFGLRAFVRGVLDPVENLPAPPLFP
jgi:glyoxylase-like metal-dependent hydrolase (beta-lactamase superfamily II)